MLALLGPTADLISELLTNKEVVLVHCSSGISRSSTIVIAYLMKHRKLSLESAYDKVFRSRPIIVPNDGFFRALQRFQTQLLGIESPPDVLAREQRFY